MVGCEIYFMRNDTNVDDIITTSLFVSLGMLNTISPTSVPAAFLAIGKSLNVVSIGCFRVVKLILIYIGSS